MPSAPQVSPLSYRRRRAVFFVLIGIFIMCVPVFIFYAMGYRIDFLADEPRILSTGGLYISTEAEEAEIYLDEEPVRNVRVFRSDAYIQGITPGVHRVHVQAPGLHTWVKELPVFPHIVTEAAAFNLPVQSQVRPVPPYLVQGVGVYPDISSTTLPFARASTTLMLMATSSRVVAALEPNPEYVYLKSLFASSTSHYAVAAPRLFDIVDQTSRFASELPPVATNTPTTTKVQHDLLLYETDGEVYVRYIGLERSIPYYYCIPNASYATTTLLYGEHVANGVANVYATQADELISETAMVRERTCRKEIRIDRKWQTVSWFDFMPDSSDHVLMLLQDGLYVVEIDDRSWQNTQLLYAGSDLTVLREGSQILVRDGDHYAELLTELIDPIN